MSATTQLMTAEDLFRMPDDGFRYELVRGDLRKTAPAGHVHGKVVMNLSTPLDEFVRANGLGAVYAAETGFKIATNPDVVRAPDVAFITQQRIDQVGDVEGYWPGAPDLVCEVISPHDIYADVEEKISDWLEAGVRMVILVNPKKRRVTIYRSLTHITILTGKDAIDGDDVVLGWRLPASEIFI